MTMTAGGNPVDIDGLFVAALRGKRVVSAATLPDLMRTTSVELCFDDGTLVTFRSEEGGLTIEIKGNPKGKQ